MPAVRLSLVATLLVACASSPGPADDEATGEEPTSGDEGHASAADPEPLAADDALIALGLPDPRMSERSQGFRAAWAVALTELALTPPEAPADPEGWEAWTRGPVGEWFEQRRLAGAATNEAFNEVADEPMPEPLMAASVLGLVSLDTGQAVLGLAPTDEQVGDPETAEMLRGPTQGSGDAFFGIAQTRFEYCARSAADLRIVSWSSWCAARRDEVMRVRAELTETPGG